VKSITIPLSKSNSVKEIRGIEKDSIIFFEDEALNKSHICNSMMRIRSSNMAVRLPARLCEFITLDSTEAKAFFDKNHISGHTKCAYYFGLKYDFEIVSAISFRRPFTRGKDGVIEIGRFCSCMDMIVVGGLSKLLARAIPILQSAGFSKILTYADLRFGEGKSYSKCGFEFVGKTQEDYFYTDGHARYNRFGYRARDGMTEKEYATSKGVWKVYGRGSNIYMKDIGRGSLKE